MLTKAYQGCIVPLGVLFILSMALPARVSSVRTASGSDGVVGLRVSSVRTASGSGSPSGQPAWGGGSDRVVGSRLRPITQKAQKADKTDKACFTAEARALAERTAKVWQPDPDYDPVLGYSSSKGPRVGAPPVDSNGLAMPIKCVVNKDESKGSGTTPKFHCSVPGVVDADGDLVRNLTSRGSRGKSGTARSMASLL